MSKEKPPSTRGLRSYQAAGVEWLSLLYRKKRNGILADEMGLGKTIQVLSFLKWLKDECNIYGPHLIVLPLSVISSWVSEIERCSIEGMDDFGTYIHYGDTTSREENFQKITKLWKKSISYKTKDSKENRKIFLLFFTFEMIIKDIDLLLRFNRQYDFCYLIVDEAHRLKNNQSVLYHRLLNLRVRRKILLTGTPLQNTVKELISLLYFIKTTGTFEKWKRFVEDEEVIDEELRSKLEEFETSIMNEDDFFLKHDLLRNEKKRLRSPSKLLMNSTNDDGNLVLKLQEALKPFILRRKKEEVCLDLPPKVEKIVYCPQSPLQRKIYETLGAKVLNERQNQKMKKTLPRELLLEDCGEEYSFHNIIMQLRKICDHSFLFLEDIKTIPDDIYFNFLLHASGKLNVLDRLLNSLMKQDSKVLLFSQFTTMLTILEGYLQLKKINYLRFDGSTDRFEREISIQEFQTKRGEDAARVFLLSTRAGGVGINLQQADTVILYDSDWNPQQDIQAISRAHRIGQVKPVLVLRLVSLGPDSETLSIDEFMILKAQKKLVAEQKIFTEGKFSSLSEQKGPTTSVMTEYENDFDWWFQEDDETEMSSVKSSDSLEKLVSTLFTKREGLDHQQDLVFEEPSLVESKLLERESQTADSFTMPLSNDNIDLSCWDSWLDLLLPRRSTPNLSTGANLVRSSPRKRNAVISKAEVDYLDDDLPLDMTSEFDDDEFFPIKKIKAGRRKKPSSPATHALRNKRKRSKRFDGANAKEIESDNAEDVCCVCGQLWISKEDFAQLPAFVRHCHESETDQFSLCDTLILCDGCEGCFHVLCVGLNSIPQEDWFCNFCSVLEEECIQSKLL